MNQVNLFSGMVFARMTSPLPIFLLLDDHPAPLPARRVLDCVFGLTAQGRILHFHLGQLREEAGPEGPCYRLVDPDGAPDRVRCRVIPPLVPEFRR